MCYRYSRIFIGFCLLLRVAGPASGQAPVFAVQTVDGKSATGTLEELSANGSVRLGGAKPTRIEGSEVLRLRQVGRSLPARPRGEQVLFANGDCLAGKVHKLVEERLHFRPDFSMQMLNVPLTLTSVIWLATPEGTVHPDRLRRQLAVARRTRDAVLLRNGDVLEGVLSGLESGRAVEVEVDKKVVSVDYAKVAAVAAESAGAAQSKGVHLRVVLADGSRLSLATARCGDGKTLEGMTTFRTPVQLPLEQVLALDRSLDRSVNLSDLKPARHECSPYLDVQSPPVMDGSVGGGDLCLADSTYDKGIGMHSGSRVHYDLAGRYQRFEALAGLDDRTGRGGSVRIVVLVDGKEQPLGGPAELTRRNGPLAVNVNVAGAKQLTLAVEFGPRGPVADHVNWVDACLIK